MRPWAGVAAVVAGHAAVQTALVLADPVPAVSWGFALAAVGSGAALVLAVRLLVVLVAGPVPAVVRRVLSVAAVAVALSLVSPLLVPVVLALACPVLVAGTPTVRAFPVRSALLFLGALVLAALSWVAALLAGFFVGGPMGAFLTWLWFGAAAALVLRGWATPNGDRGEVRVDAGADPDAQDVPAEQASGHGEHD